jgi:hypothetical protein
MTAAEIMLRIGASLGGWLIFIAHAATLAALSRVEWNSVSDAQMRGTALLGALAGLALAGVGLGLPFRNGIRWLAVVALALALWAAWGVWPALMQTTRDVPRSWALFQLAVLAAGITQALRFGRPLPAEPSLTRRSGDT